MIKILAQVQQVQEKLPQSDTGSNNINSILYNDIANAGPSQICIQGSGTPDVDGVYDRAELVSNAWRYKKRGIWNKTYCTFNILQWPLNNETRYWYICMIPDGQDPGSSSDVDFYKASVQDDCLHIPPKIGWMRAMDGKDPSPELFFTVSAAHQTGAHGILSPSEASDRVVGLSDQSIDSRHDHANTGPIQIVVQGAGNPAVDGIFSRDKWFSNAWSYIKCGQWNGNACVFYIFQCVVSNSTRHWYISIVPNGKIPGKTSDIDFYKAPVRSDSLHVPPKMGWRAVKEGKNPSPGLVFWCATNQ